VEEQPDRAAHVIGCVLHHSAATAAVKEDARIVLNSLAVGYRAVVEALSDNAPLAEIVALILDV